MVSKLENDTFTFKESTSQYERLEFVEATRKEISVYENDKHWTLVKRRDLMGRRPSCIYGPSREIGIQMGVSSNTKPAYAPMEACRNGV